MGLVIGPGISITGGLAFDPPVSGGGDANLGFNTSSYTGSNSFIPIVTFTFQGSGTVPLEEGSGGTGGIWYNGTAPGYPITSNFEIQAEMTSLTGNLSAVFFDPGAGELVLNTPTAWFSLVTNRSLYIDESGNAGVVGTAVVTVRIREIAVPTNITTATFTMTLS